MYGLLEVPRYKKIFKIFTWISDKHITSTWYSITVPAFVPNWQLHNFTILPRWGARSGELPTRQLKTLRVAYRSPGGCLYRMRPCKRCAVWSISFHSFVRLSPQKSHDNITTLRHHYYLIYTQLTDSAYPARPRDWNPSHTGTAADQYRQISNLSQAARDSNDPADLERGVYVAQWY